MAIATAVVGDGGPMPAGGALVEVTAQRGGAAARNGPQHFDMLPADPPAASLDEAVSRSTDEIGNFECGPVHLLVLQHQPAEMGHGNLPVTHTYTSNERQPMFRSANAKRSPPGGYVQTPLPYKWFCLDFTSPVNALSRNLCIKFPGINKSVWTSFWH
jgi:hypothetical protein